MPSLAEVSVAGSTRNLRGSATPRSRTRDDNGEPRSSRAGRRKRGTASSTTWSPRSGCCASSRRAARRESHRRKAARIRRNISAPRPALRVPPRDPVGPIPRSPRRPEPGPRRAPRISRSRRARCRWPPAGATGEPPAVRWGADRSLAVSYQSPLLTTTARMLETTAVPRLSVRRARGVPVLADEKRFVPDFQLVVDGAAADPELKGAVLGIRVTDDMDKASRFWVHLSDVDRKWTKQNKFKPGAAVEIKLGYQGQLESVCKGEISNIEMVLSPEGPTRLIIAGVDRGHAFDKGTLTQTYQDVKDSDLATRIAQRHGLTADVDDSKVVHDYVIQNNLSDYDFLMQRAAIAGFRMYVDDKKLLFKKPKVGEPPAAKLVWRENIGRLVQEVNTFDQVSKITTSGWDPGQAKNMTGPGKGGDEYGKQGGTVTGAQLVKQMFGEIEQIVPVASGQQNLLEAVAKSEFNKRAGAFVHAEARVTGDPKIRAGSVVEVEKAGKRVDGQYYVVSSEHLFFVDTGYATELRAKRYTIKKGSPPAKDVAKFAKSVQEAAQKAQESADKIKDAAAWALKAAREAAKRAGQALDAAKQVWQDVKDALNQVKQGAGDVAQAALKSVESRLAGLKDYVAQATAKVGEAAQEAANAAQEVAREALTKAHEAASQVTEIARNAIQHAKDAFDAVKAAALDAVHTQSDSGAVKGLKTALMTAADMAIAVGKAGMTLAQAAIVKAKSAIEMCAASATAAAKSLIDGLGGELDKVISSVKSSGDAAGKSIGSAIAAGAQNVLDAAKDAIKQAQDAIAKAKEALQNAKDTIQKNVGDKLKGLVDQAKGMIDQVKEGLELLKDKKWDDAGKEVDPAQSDFETAKTEAQLVFDKLQEVEKEP